MGWGTYTGWGKSRANTSSLWGRRGDRSYRLINSYNVEEGRTVRVCFSVPALQDPPWFSLLFRPCVTTFRFLGPLDALLMSCYLHTSLLRHWGTQSQRKRAKTTLASSGCTGCRGALGSLCLFSARMCLRREMRAHGMTGWLVSASSGCWPEIFLSNYHLEICCILEETNLTRKLKTYGPKMNRNRKTAQG